ncbi:hypothetical protein M409DRAFT_57302 [Zasmidium cellare ATCC 36951]|uniref:Phytanoyl-CoA dioxygenase family protein n=1 Tax=Zasmidium cellare ATCC 36951 TaxID=1080233 RepID=A0A6A6C9G8_ZASCE|nr:uncharacterized protein M409DRAFT_57302 [Zasmidium cellare ATCC 36951]KAF2163827.1 hypothetical protein M409DRAFT_57302 [Zasmidium cellare ATCC 36951]
MTRIQNGNANDHELYNQEVHKVRIKDSERDVGTAGPEIIAEAITYLHRDGIVVLENVIDPSHINALEAKLGPEAEEIARNPDHHFNWNKGNMDQAPPLIPDLMFQDIWANPIVVSVLSSVLGPSPVCHYANGNTALKSTARQPVHSDVDKPHPLYPFAYAVNIPLCDLSVENGSTEIWVGSHGDSNIDQHNQYADGEHDLTIKTELVEERRQHSPPVQPSTKKGSIILRDLRLWHAGMPNKTTTPRIMLAFVIQPKWFQAPSKVLLPVKAKKLVQQWERDGLEYAAKWVDGDVDHKLT